MNEIFISCPKIIVKIYFCFDLFISFLRNKGDSLLITITINVTILIFLCQIFAGIVADFSDLNDFPFQT